MDDWLSEYIIIYLCLCRAESGFKHVGPMEYKARLLHFHGFKVTDCTVCICINLTFRTVFAGLCLPGCVFRTVFAGLCLPDCVCRIVFAGLCLPGCVCLLLLWF